MKSLDIRIDMGDNKNNNNQRNKVFTIDVMNTNCSNTTIATTAPADQQHVLYMDQHQQQQQQPPPGQQLQQQHLPGQHVGPASAPAIVDSGFLPQSSGISIISAQNMSYNMAGTPSNMNQSYSQTHQPPPGYPQWPPPPGYSQYNGPPPPGYPQYYGPPPPGYPQYQGPPPPGYPPYYGPPPSGYPQDQNPPPPPAWYQDVVVVQAKFETKEDRIRFIRGVYSILLVQLMCFFGVVLLMLFNEPLREKLSHPVVIVVSMAMYLGVIIYSFCCNPEKMMTTNATSVSTLIIITASLSLMSGYISSKAEPMIVLMAIGLTLIITLALTLVAFTCSYDFTKLRGIMGVALLLLILFGIVTIFLKDMFPILDIIYAYLGAGLFCIYIIMDTQMLMSGKKTSLEPTMYVFGAIMLFIDIIQLFLFILKILNDSK